MDIQKKLISNALKIVGKFPLNVKDNSAGGAACALITKQGNIYTGISMSIDCGIGFCAEASAISEMLKNHETEIEMIVAVHYKGPQIITPCGRCRELIYQVNKNNINTKIIVDNDKYMLLSELLPDIWLEKMKLNSTK